MKRSGPRRRRLVIRARAAEAGLTLIELLLSLAILGILVGFVASGLMMARRAFNVDWQSELASETDSGVEAVASLVATAMPFPAGRSIRQATFEGTQARLAFVGLSEGRSLRGGPQLISVTLRGGDLVVDLGGTVSPDGQSGLGTVVARGVRQLRFGYFGALDNSLPRRWQTEWTSGERLPELVSIQLEFSDVRRNEPSRVIALRQE